MDISLYAKRKEIKYFIDKVVSHFIDLHTVPTLYQIKNYILSDKWANENVVNYEPVHVENGFEFISLTDLCKNIQNLCSFNLDDIYESKQIKLRIKE